MMLYDLKLRVTWRLSGQRLRHASQSMSTLVCLKSMSYLRRGVFRRGAGSADSDDAFGAIGSTDDCLAVICIHIHFLFRCVGGNGMCAESAARVRGTMQAAIGDLQFAPHQHLDLRHTA
jgi:hypothetical protein